MSQTSSSVTESPQEVAAAARLNKGTLYRILGGETQSPHTSTLRRLCKVLGIPLSDLLDAEQLDLLDQLEKDKSYSADLARTLSSRLDMFEGEDRRRAAALAVFAILEVKVGAVGGSVAAQLESVSSAGTSEVASAVVDVLGSMPCALQPAALRAALGALLDLQIIQAGATRTGDREMHVLRHRRWRSVDRRKSRAAVGGSARTGGARVDARPQQESSVATAQPPGRSH
jgi:transcriptional regulator with XRE-family HTH domain